MPPPEFHHLLPGLWLWQRYDPAVKADLFSTAIWTQFGVYLVDPIPLPDDQIGLLTEAAPMAGIVVTNANHQRSAGDLSERLSLPIFANPAAFPDSKPARFNALTGDERIDGELDVIEIEGAVAGEIALYQPTNGGTLIVGDALINFEPYGFTFLPKKYCENEKRLRSSLRQLLTKPAERILFAHGTPILSGATSRLRQLFES